MLPIANQGTRLTVPAWGTPQVMQHKPQDEIDAAQLREAKLQDENRKKVAEAQAILRAEAKKTPEQKEAGAQALRDAYTEANPVLRCPKCGFAVEKLGVNHIVKSFGKCIANEKLARQSGMTQDAIDSYNDARSAFLSSHPNSNNQI